MKYRAYEVSDIPVLEDRDILPNPRLTTELSDYEIARRMEKAGYSCSHSYISLLRNGKRIASPKFYNNLKEVLTSE